MDGGKPVQDICRERTIAEQTIYRWKMLKNRVLSYACEKSCEPGTTPGISTGSGGTNAVFATAGAPVFEAGPLDV